MSDSKCIFEAIGNRIMQSSENLMIISLMVILCAIQSHIRSNSVEAQGKRTESDFWLQDMQIILLLIAEVASSTNYNTISLQFRYLRQSLATTSTKNLTI